MVLEHHHVGNVFDEASIFSVFLKMQEIMLPVKKFGDQHILAISDPRPYSTYLRAVEVRFSSYLCLHKTAIGHRLDLRKKIQ